jgi:hypothetical protein
MNSFCSPGFCGVTYNESLVICDILHSHRLPEAARRVGLMFSELSDLREIVDELPSTADGFKVSPGTRLWGRVQDPQDGRWLIQDWGMCDPAQDGFVTDAEGLRDEASNLYVNRDNAAAEVAGMNEGGAK